jgi:uncharacterized membrane protein AbrB (regulator of aidB expression)
MEDRIVVFILVVVLIVYFWIDKKNFKNFSEKDSYEKFNAVRVYFILILGIVLFTLKTINE